MTLSISVTELDPESTEIASVADDIVKSQVTCSPDEKTKLKEQKAALEEGINKAQASLQEVQEKLEELTGTTVAPTTAVTTSAPTTGKLISIGTLHNVQRFKCLQPPPLPPLQRRRPPLQHWLPPQQHLLPPQQHWLPPQPRQPPQQVS